MKRSVFVPMLDRRLEDRVVPTTHLAHAAVTTLPPATFGGGQIDYTIPYVHASKGVSQHAINFTSNTFHQVVDGASSAFNSFNKSGKVATLEYDLAKLAKKIPYGVTDLLPAVQDELTGLSFSNRDINHSVQKQVYQDLISYLDAGIGQDFNILKSGVHYSTDVLLTFNGKVS